MYLCFSNGEIVCRYVRDIEFCLFHISLQGTQGEVDLRFCFEEIVYFACGNLARAVYEIEYGFLNLGMDAGNFAFSATRNPWSDAVCVQPFCGGISGNFHMFGYFLNGISAAVHSFNFGDLFLG